VLGVSVDSPPTEHSVLTTTDALAKVGTVYFLSSEWVPPVTSASHCCLIVGLRAGRPSALRESAATSRLFQVLDALAGLSYVQRSISSARQTWTRPPANYLMDARLDEFASHKA
jgi:hypothetical protein